MVLQLQANNMALHLLQANNTELQANNLLKAGLHLLQANNTVLHPLQANNMVLHQLQAHNMEPHIK